MFCHTAILFYNVIAGDNARILSFLEPKNGKMMECSKARAELEASARAYLDVMSDDALEVVIALLKDAARDHPRHNSQVKPALITVSKVQEK